MSEGGFSLRKWATNNPTLREEIASHEVDNSVTERTSEKPIAEDGQTYAASSLGTNVTDSCENIRKVIGLQWNTTEDKLVFDMKNYSDLFVSNTPITKRKVLSVISKVYDSIGLIAPVTITMKVLFQQLCKDGVDWDQTISEELYSKVKELKDDLEECKTIQAARCYVEDIADEIKSVELLGFADATIVAYAAVVYIRVLTATGNRVQLVACKTRVAPLVKKCIPRLEILSETILARLINYLYPRSTQTDCQD
ncbi:Hypothetical predicted protein [Paramuricea clavata]|uniref:Uncharacterized protein n=1 Tax=Paramuricea clavata TaxID=317549 RepID=A0A6S7H643_PARCT|nr:Hypothetical predicted protein [Paramuricea clavata]